MPQFHRNSLELPTIDKQTLTQALADLQTAVVNGVNIIEERDPAKGEYDGRGIFTGELGIALTYLRLAHQAPLLASPVPDFKSLASARIPNHGPDLPLHIGGLSPLPSKSPIAAVSLRILDALSNSNAAGAEADISCLNDAIDLALSHGSTGFYHGHNLGADEVLFGRTGLLWSLVNIRAKATESSSALEPILARIPALVRAIIESGREGVAEYIKEHGKEGALPLMWIWKPGGYGIGWAHGLTGIIPILLACDELKASGEYLQEIGGTITGLCNLCIKHNGHLPTTIPPHSSRRESPLVQICHGAPAILGLLGCALKSGLLWDHWTPEWEKAAYLATERVWEQGLLSKGGGLCHGIAGNAWPLLLLHDAYEYNSSELKETRKRSASSVAESQAPTSDYFLSRALAMLLHARETRPYKSSSEEYRLPDHPYSLFEGLAGTVCAWAETCAVIKARLRKMESGHINDEAFKDSIKKQLGFPCMGGSGAMGFL
ncbi:hypothetical protein BDV18DRAFT_49900 [Aspergillus unguis]